MSGLNMRMLFKCELTMTNTKDFVGIERARAVILNRFTALLCQPEEEVLCSDEVFDTLKRAFDIVDPDATPLVSRMQQAVSQGSVQALLVEYTKLFIGPFKTLVPPYASLYLGSDSLMSEETVWVVNCYRKSGLEFDVQELKDAPDHIAVETEFMYYLIHSELSELEAGKHEESLALWQNQQEFFNQHYKKWVPQFCAKLATETGSDYYKALSECLNRFVSHVDIPAFPK